ncbi:MAG: hypothetical protein WBC91_14835 [Phototrophicaceae bacterium]
MNDDLAGQLTSDWLIPDYAKGRLWLDSDAGSARCDGMYGLFELQAPTQVVTVRWNSDTGIPLTQLQWQIDNLHWDGSVRLGGLVESVHLTEIKGIDFPMAIVAFSGQPLRPTTSPYADAGERHMASLPVPDYLEGVDDEIEPMIVPLITFADSPLVAIAQDALVQKHPLHIYGTLDNSDSAWHEFFALPIIWESVTVFAP